MVGGATDRETVVVPSPHRKLRISPIETIAHVIQLAVAPVFLLTGIGGMLSVITNRLSRIVDHARLVTAMVAFIIALLSFLREVFVAIAGLRFGIRQTDKP